MRFPFKMFLQSECVCGNPQDNPGCCLEEYFGCALRTIQIRFCDRFFGWRRRRLGKRGAKATAALGSWPTTSMNKFTLAQAD